MKIHWEPRDLRDPFVRTIANTVLVHLERAASPEACDLILHPFDVRCSLESLPRIVAHAEEAKRLGRRLLVFQVSDTCVPIAAPKTLVFRTSLPRSRRLPHEHLLPYVWDPVPTAILAAHAPNAENAENTENAEISSTAETAPSWIDRADLPVVGFCGCPDTHPLRRRVIDRLPASLPCRFLLRDRFWAGAPHDPKVVRAFFDNILATSLTLVVRGAGNFSHRLYQTLSCGRSPLLVDTDCVLPYEGLDPLPWEEILVRVEATRLDEIATAVERFHERTRIDASLPSRIERLHRTYFTPAGLADHLARHREHYLG